MPLLNQVSSTSSSCLTLTAWPGKRACAAASAPAASPATTQRSSFSLAAPGTPALPASASSVM